MTKKILSEIFELNGANSKLNTEYIESVLSEKFGDIIRWAIVKAENGHYTISVTYSKNA